MACWEYWPAVLLLLRLDHDLKKKIFHPPGNDHMGPTEREVRKIIDSKVIWDGICDRSQEGKVANKNGSIMASTHGRKLTFPMRSDGGNTMKWTASRKNQRIILFISRHCSFDSIKQLCEGKNGLNSECAYPIPSHGNGLFTYIWLFSMVFMEVNIPFFPWMVWVCALEVIYIYKYIYIYARGRRFTEGSLSRILWMVKNC